MFTLLTTPLQRILKRHGIKYHKYADDLQLFIIFAANIPGDRERAVAQKEECVQEIRQWMAYRWLKLNDEKTEITIFTAKYHLNQYGTCNIEIGNIPSVLLRVCETLASTWTNISPWYNK